MTINYLTPEEAIEKYGLNHSKVRAALLKSKMNGLYKAIYRKRTKIHLRQDFFENWMRDNDVKSPSYAKKVKEPERPKGPKLKKIHPRDRKNW